MSTGRLQEILESHQAPYGFVANTSTPTRQEASQWKRDAELIQAKRDSGRQCWGKTGAFKLAGVMPFDSNVRMEKKNRDGSYKWKKNKDAVEFERRRGNPLATLNPALGRD